MLGRLRSLDAGDMGQRTDCHPIRIGIRDDQGGSQQDNRFRVPDLMGFSTGQLDDKRLKRATVNPFSNRFGVHAPKCTTVDHE